MFSLFEPYPELIATISEKKDGTMKLLTDVDLHAPAAHNREHFFTKVGIDPVMVAAAEIVHGNIVQVVSSENCGVVMGGADGLVTNDPYLFLSVTVADCMPIFLFDPVRRVIGLVHAGWKGLASGILENAVQLCEKNFGSDPRHILAAVGPCICQNHYEVGSEVVDFFKKKISQQIIDRVALAQSDGKYLLDLRTIAKQQLIGVGLQERNIEVSQECTFELPERYFSYRRDRTEPVEAMVAGIGLTS